MSIKTRNRALKTEQKPDRNGRKPCLSGSYFVSCVTH